MQNLGMNSYVYAPKDDAKHRVYWREPYSVEESGKYCYFEIQFRNYAERRDAVRGIYICCGCLQSI